MALSQMALRMIALKNAKCTRTMVVKNAVFRGATRQSGVAGRKILEVAQARAGQAQWLLRFHEEEAVIREFGATFPRVPASGVAQPEKMSAQPALSNAQRAAKPLG
jgi:hypothetical protein